MSMPNKLLSVARANRKEGERFAKFMVVGAIGFVVDFVTFTICAQFLHLPTLVAQAISFSAAIVSNFTWNRYWTYPESRTKRIRHQLLQFVLVNLAGLGIRTVIFGLVEAPYRRWFASVGGLPIEPRVMAQYASLASAVLVVLLWNFFVNRYWTYNDVS
jgi:putative flippase GtrA